MSASPSAPRQRMIFLRALIWSLIGLIYAPLFAALRVLFEGIGLGHAAYVPAAALAGAIGAAFYGARQVALAGTTVGMVVGTALFFMLPGTVPLWQVVLAAAAVGAGLGGVVRFPDRCSFSVPGKTLAGLVTGAACGGLLALAESLHPENFNIVGAVAFLVSVNGVLYVATARWWVGLVRLTPGQACNLVEALVIATLAAAAAGSLWVISGPLIGVVDGTWQALIAAMHRDIFYALAGGLFGGAVAGAMMEAFAFRWVHDI